MNIEKFKQAVAELELTCRENEPMCKHTTFLIGGNADLMVDVNDVSKLAEVFLVAKEFDIPLTVIGNGSNLLISDKGIEGAVIRICDETVEVCGDRIKCAAGAKLSRVAAMARDASRSPHSQP